MIMINKNKYNFIIIYVKYNLLIYKLYLMYIILDVLIFSLIIFLYINTYFHIKRSNYLEIYEIENTSKEKFEELCDLKQPILLNNYDTRTVDINTLINSYGNFDIFIKKNNHEISLPLKLEDSIKLFNIDSSINYISENNKEFLIETCLNKTLFVCDIFLRPYYLCNIVPDIIMGSKNSYINLRCKLDCRNYFYINSGSIEINMTVPSNYKYLHVNEKLENLLYESEIDIYNIEDKYLNDFNKIKLLKIILLPGQLLQIPAGWFYNIKFLDSNIVIYNYSCTTYMNFFSLIPLYIKKFVQEKNIVNKITKIID